MSRLSGNRLGDPRWLQTEFLVQADYDHYLHFWCQNASDSPYRPDLPKVHWDCKGSVGRVLTIGTCDGRPVNMDFLWVRLNGVLVCFYDCCSQVTDWELVEQWLSLYWLKGHDRTCNAANFHRCLYYVEARTLYTKSNKIKRICPEPTERALAQAVLTGDRIAARALHDRLTEMYGEETTA